MLRWITKFAELYTSDGRRNPRLPARFVATLAGPFGTIPVTGVDANRNGAGVELMQHLEAGTLVFLKIAGTGLMGFAHVRHCSPCSTGYLAGLEFRDGLERRRAEFGEWEYERRPQGASPVWDEAEA